MKIVLEHEPFLKALATAARVIDKRNTVPVLSNLLFKTNGNSVSIFATDLDIELIQYLMSEEDNEQSAITIPGNTLRDYVAKLPKGCQVSLETNGKEAVVIKGARSRMTLNTMRPEDFPEFSNFEPVYSVEIEGFKLKSLLEPIKHCISTEETRYYLTGIYLIQHEGKMRAVATNGHVLGLREEAPHQTPEGEPIGVIIPRHTVEKMIHMAESAEAGLLTLKVSQNRLSLEGNTIILTSKLIDGTFPDYGRVIPTGNNNIACLDKADLTAALARVTAVSGERGKAVKFSFTRNTLTLTVVNSDTGTAIEDIDIDYEGGDLDIGFNAKYIEQHLASITGTHVRFCMNDSGSPTLITGDLNRDSDFRVVMPMRV